ncbi:MAG: LVIVD repeat-containing protein [Cyclobacteriaceae bacterium]
MKSFATIAIAILCLNLIQAQPLPVTLKADKDPLQLEVGATSQIKVNAYNSEGEKLEDRQCYFFMLRETGFVASSGAQVDSLGNVTGLIPGIYNLVMIRPGSDTEAFARDYLRVEVAHKPVAEVALLNFPAKVYAGTSIALQTKVTDEAGFTMEDSEVKITSSNPTVASLDALNHLITHRNGNTTITVQSGTANIDLPVKVLKNPIARIDLVVSQAVARTGDVLHFKASAKDKSGKPVEEVPFVFTVSGQVKEDGAGAAAIIQPNGKFVAEQPGAYTILVSSGNSTASKSVQIKPRDIQRELNFVGKGSISDQHTSDLWVWEGVDGKDYAVTGTWGGQGKAYFWNVSNPENLQLIDSIQVDARTVNDVKVSEDGRVCVISREGASNRKNGLVILDVTNPNDVKTISTFDDQLTGGVHNVFIYQDHIYALSNGQRYDVINIEDPANPKRVGKFELDNPARAIHDVWIEDGIAYSSNWNDGVVMVDVGNGIANGSPENPVEISRSKVQGDANHAAFPFKSQSTGKFYVIAGDEIFPVNWDPNKVTIPSGYLHFLDFTDLDNPKEVARYEIPGAGSHNFWVEGDLLYIAYYNAGVRVLDISGELMGDLYRQGREIGYYLPLDSEGYLPNAAMTWGAQPHKGHIFFSDHNSGLWSGKLAGPKPEAAVVAPKQ